ncbi:GGDEF domain-containing protein [Eubacterium sp. 1001713B170207_170306_E7]|uniref:GGDEF domain-containing protein n=1 Tax=Eubacterium sp. 1001713B170207_170306_E7 TaxID=2787097 RepID=UPI0018997701|nr:GGDEF domain-containing protein [Eubacterium sp. 1001713B170207_170306_E7]
MNNVLLPTLAIGVIYFYQNWQLFRYAETVFEKRLKRGWIVLCFFLNYSLFFACSVLMLDLMANWLLYAVFVLIELLWLFRCPLRDGVILALISMIIGLALNLSFRCLVAALTGLHLTVFSNASQDIDNLKRYPVGLGFLFSGLFFYLAHRVGHRSEGIRMLFKDPGQKNFLIRLGVAIYLYLVLNLLIFSLPDNRLVLKLWGLKSGVFALLGLYLAMRYAARISRLNRYRALNRQVIKELRLKKQEEQQLNRIAASDPLTGCLNRQKAQETLEALYSEALPFCLCFLDLDGLKSVNDHHGHDTGDLYLLTVVQTLRGVCRKGRDTLFRYGGDEFMIIFSGSSIPAVSGRLQRVNQTLGDLSRSSGYPFAMSVSYGLAESAGFDSPDALFAAADARMYAHKKRPGAVPKT